MKTIFKYHGNWIDLRYSYPWEDVLYGLNRYNPIGNIEVIGDSIIVKSGDTLTITQTIRMT